MGQYSSQPLGELRGVRASLQCEEREQIPRTNIGVETSATSVISRINLFINLATSFLQSDTTARARIFLACSDRDRKLAHQPLDIGPKVSDHNTSGELLWAKTFASCGLWEKGEPPDVHGARSGMHLSMGPHVVSYTVPQRQCPM